MWGGVLMVNTEKTWHVQSLKTFATFDSALQAEFRSYIMSLLRNYEEALRK